MSTGLRFTLEVDGLPPDAFAVVSFHLNQSLSSLFSLDLSLVSQQFLSLEFAQVLDKMAYLTIWQGDEVQRRVKGVVTWFELGENDKNQMLYSMKVHPPLWRAGLRQNFRIFQNEDIKSILGTMLQENGVTEWSPLFSEPHPSREFCVQYGERLITISCAGWRRRKASSFMRSMLTKVPTRAWCCATQSAICPNLLKSHGTRTPVPR